MSTPLQISSTFVFKRIVLTFFFLNTCLLAVAQLNSTSSQTISTNQTYTGASTISSGSTVTISGGTTTFTGSLTVGNGGVGVLNVKSGATVIINGSLSIGTASNGSVIIENGGKLIINPGATTGTAAININSSATTAFDIQTGGSVIVNTGTGGMFGMYETSASNVNVAGSLQIRGGGFKMDGTAKLTYSGSGNDTIVGPSNAGAYFSNSSKLTVGAGVNLYISGDVKNDSNAEFAINGNVSINGDYQSGNTTANITGTGSVTTTGSMDSDSYQGSIFGQRYSCATGPCAGNNFISSSNTSTCNGGTVVISGNAITGATYQWLISTTSASSGFATISGATSQNYSTTGSGTTQYTYYKRQSTVSSQTYNSNTLTITSTYWTNSPITGFSSICVGGSTTLSDATSGGTWSSGTPGVATINSSGLVTAVALGTTVISYTVTSGGCTGSVTFNLSVISVSAPIVTTATTSGTYTIPAGAKAVIVQVWGGGGGGSKGYSNLKGTGGGGGGVSQKSLAATPGDIITYTVGAAGIGGIVSGNGTDGGTTTATLNSEVVSASGGSGGQSTSTPGGSGGNGGTGLGDFNLSGGTGAVLVAPSSGTPGGGGGGSAGTSLNGNNAGNSSPGSGSTGGTAVAGGGAGGNGNGTANGNGSAGGFPGGGGGGNAGTGNGGNGGGGQVIITVYYTRIAYSSPKFCKSVTSALPTITGVTSGTYSSTSGLTINSVTGEINPSTSTVGNYTVTFSNTTCGTLSYTFVGILPVSTASAGGSQTICQSGTATVTGATSSNGTIAWTENGAGSITSGATTLTPVYTPVAADAGTTVTLTMTVSNGLCANATATYSVIVKASPTATAGGSQTICQSGTATVTGATSSNGTIAWTENGAGSITSGASTLAPVYTPLAADAGNTVTLTMTVTNSPCTNATATYSVIVKASPTATAGGSQTICQSGTATVTGATSSNGTIAWTENGAGSITSGASTLAPVYTPIAADAGNTVTLTMTVTNSPCTNATATYSVIVSTCSRTWTGATNTDWATNTNWSPTNIPTTIDDAIIPSSVVSGRMPTISSTTNVKSLTNSGTLTFTSAGTLNVSGNVTNSGTFTPVSGSTVAFNGSTAQSMTGVPALYNVVINNTSGGVSVSSALTVKGTISLTKGVLTTNSNLTINFDNGGNIGYSSSDLGSISGTVSGYRMAGVKTHYIAAPFSGVTSAQVQATTPLFVNPYWKMYSKNFTAQNWAAVINTTTAMPLGTGFSLSFPVAAPLILTGTYDHTFTFTGDNYSNAAANKYLMVGNPYPSTLDWNAASGWTKTNVGDAIYYWDGVNNRTASYVAGVGTNGGTQYIPAMQSVLISTTGSGGSSSVSINNNARLSLQNPSYFRVAAPDDIIRITLVGTDTIYKDETVIRFNEMATDNFDYDLDARKILNTGFMPSVYTTSGSDLYSINSFESVDSAQSIPLGAKLITDGAYRLKIVGTNPNIEYVLVDKLLATKHLVDSSAAYVFNGLRTDDVNRFELQLQVSSTTGTTGVQSSNKNGGLTILSSTKGFVLKTDRYAGEVAEIEIFDITGNSLKVLSGKTLSAGSTYVPLDLPDGSYLVKVHMDSNNFAGMIVLLK